MKIVALLPATSMIAMPGGVALASHSWRSIAFIGQLEWSKRYPRHGFTKPATESSSMQFIQVSNNCGKAKTKFEVIKPLVGPDVNSLTINSKLGEWCKPPTSISRDPVFVPAVNKGDDWVLTAIFPIKTDKDGTALILPDYSENILGIATYSVRKALRHPVYMAPAKDVPAPYKHVMEKRNVLRQFGADLYFVTGVYITDLQKALDREPVLLAQKCIAQAVH